MFFTNYRKKLEQSDNNAVRCVPSPISNLINHKGSQSANCKLSTTKAAQNYKF